jgi:hypothetical protein
MGTEKKNVSIRDIIKARRRARKRAADLNNVAEEPFRSPQGTSSVGIDPFGGVEIKTRQEQKVIPRGGVNSVRNPQLGTESSNNTEVKGIVAPFMAALTKQDLHDLGDVEFAVAMAGIKAQVRKNTAIGLAMTEGPESVGNLGDMFDQHAVHVQAKLSDNIRGGNPNTPRNNKYKVSDPTAPTTSNGVDQNRISYDDLNALFQDKFLTNKLYFNEDDTAGFNLVAYNITLFALPANIVLGHRINEVAMKGLDAYKNNAIIVTQSAGTDEFYIEGLSFKTTIGKNPDQGTGTQPLDVTVTIKAPTNNDFIDLLIKASIVGGWQDHTEMPMFIHVEWNGRNSITDAPEKQINKIFRCFPVRIAKAGAATLDEGGSTYELTFVSYRAQVFNNQLQTTQEEITVSGYTVGEILTQITTEMYKLETNGKDVHIIPDEIYIEFPETSGGGINKIKDYKMVVGKGKLFDNVANQKAEFNPKTSIATPEPKGHPSRNVSSSLKNSESTSKAKSAHTADLNKSLGKVTITAARGTRLTDLIINLVSNTVEAQALISGLVDPASKTAAKDLKNINPDNIIREFIQIESEVILKDYDIGRRKYASKNFFKVFESSAPSYSETQQATTTQNKGVSISRLQAMLKGNFVRKCYHHMYTGLNTEIKGLEWTFDNLVFNANQLYSGIVSGYQQRQHGVQVGDAKQGAAHLGFADKALIDLRVLKEAEKQSAGAVKKAEKEVEAAKQNIEYDDDGNPMIDSFEIAKAEAKLTSEQKRHADEIISIQEKEVIRTLQGTGAKVSEKVRIINVQGMGAEQRQGIIKGLGANQRAFQKGNGPIRIISWEPASLPVALGKTTFLNDINDELVESAIDQGVMFPVKFASSVVAKTESAGIREGHDRGKNIFSEIYQSKNTNMVNVTLTIRGDPFWWPKIYQGKQLDALGKDMSVTPSISEAYCIIIADQSNTYDPETGVMEIQQRNSLNGVYQVISAVHNFSDGEYSQELALTRSTSIDLNTVFGGQNMSAAARENKAFMQKTGYHITDKYIAIDNAKNMEAGGAQIG